MILHLIRSQLQLAPPLDRQHLAHPTESAQPGIKLSVLGTLRTARKGTVLAAKAVETQGKGSVAPVLWRWPG